MKTIISLDLSEKEIVSAIQKELLPIPLTEFVDYYKNLDDGKIIVEVSYLFKHDECFKEGCDPDWDVFCVAKQIEGTEFSLTICDEF
jgi:hypothetical protein